MFFCKTVFGCFFVSSAPRSIRYCLAAISFHQVVSSKIVSVVRKLYLICSWLGFKEAHFENNGRHGFWTL